MSGNGSRRVAVVFNPVKGEPEEMKQQVIDAADRHGWQEPTFWETTVEDPGFAPAQQAAEQGYDMVFAAGGDGTVRSVAAALRGTDSTLAIIPMGTGNLLARNLKLPLDVPEAIETAFAGRDTDIDVCTALLTRPDGESEEIDFVVMAGVGLDAQMIVNTDDDLKKKIGFLAYGVAIAKSLTGGRRLHLTWRLDDGPTRRTRVHSLIVGNCGDLVASVPLLPDAVANDGHFDLVAMRPKGLAGWGLIVGRLASQMGRKVLNRLRRRDEQITGGSDDIEQLQYATARRLEVSVPTPETFEVDGDEVGKVTAFTITIEPGCLVVREPVPPPTAEPGEPRPGTQAFGG
ncbi:MAG: diacylglycerol kinase family protein [Corynebacterium sp.]|uniref:diacylglycerol/lipid kinase family protein n=1 Tax=Corynebacterium sp. TaxID=1720 RepID=UPI0026E0D57B|nr:diacylglycerol kinase family protein [Corynebacterium sp.]MDO5670203.1 diacylglycerol kinase family protein [Corynebacterium sp.]